MVKVRLPDNTIRELVLPPLTPDQIKKLGEGLILLRGACIRVREKLSLEYDAITIILCGPIFSSLLLDLINGNDAREKILTGFNAGFFSRLIETIKESCKIDIDSLASLDSLVVLQEVVEAFGW